MMKKNLEEQIEMRKNEVNKSSELSSSFETEQSFAEIRGVKEGNKAPAFTARDQDGQKVSLADHKGKKVVLYFYPEDDTPTCTIQACNLRDNYAQLKKEGFVVLGVSPDEEKKHKKFEAKYDLPFTLLADPEHKIIDKYGVWGEKHLYGRKYMGLRRTTFLIDEKGVIRKIFLKPKNKAHAEEIVKVWKEMA